MKTAADIETVIERMFGIKRGADDLTPMDYGECKKVAQEFSSIQLEERWISVKDRLPEIGAKVVVLAGEVVAISEVQNYEHRQRGGGKQAFIIDESRRWNFFTGCGYNKVTHWIPLPNPKLQSPTG